MADQPTPEPATIEQARAHVEASRARISETLDDIEERLLEKRHELREKLDVKKRARDYIDRQPLAAVAAAVGAGFLAGMIGRRRRADPLAGLDRDELRELLREARDEDGDVDADVRPISIGRHHPSFWQETRAQLVGALTAALVAAVAERLRPHGDTLLLTEDDAEAVDEDELDDVLASRRPPRRRRPHRRTERSDVD